MSRKRHYEIDIMATKGDIVKDIIADVVSREIYKETGVICSKRENTEIRANIIRLEQLVRTYDLNNPNKEVPLYDTSYKEEEENGITGFDKLKTIKMIKADLKKRTEDEEQESNS